MDEKSFIITLSKTLEREFQRNRIKYTEDFIDVFNTLPICESYIEYTGIFSRTEWNTYRAILHLKIPLNKLDSFEKYSEVILREASSLFGKQDDYYLTDLSLDVKVEMHKNFDFSVLGLNATLQQALSDAEASIHSGRYSSSVDRVHTALHGYLRTRLEQQSVCFEADDSMPKLFNLLYKEWEKVENNHINDMMLQALRSASASLDALNNIRNRYSLAHPNSEIIGENEAKFALGLAESIVNYIDIRVNNTDIS